MTKWQVIKLYNPFECAQSSVLFLLSHILFMRQKAVDQTEQFAWNLFVQTKRSLYLNKILPFQFWLYSFHSAPEQSCSKSPRKKKAITSSKVSRKIGFSAFTHSVLLCAHIWQLFTKGKSRGWFSAYSIISYVSQICLWLLCVTLSHICHAQFRSFDIAERGQYNIYIH